MNDINESIIADCKGNNRSAQEKLYRMYYGYAMRISLPYTRHEDEAKEIINDGFIKVFNHLHLYDNRLPFKGWFRKILINTAIDNFRHNKNHYHHLDSQDISIPDFNDNVIDEMAANEILTLVQELPPAYRIVFNLYALEGYKHHEIASMLDISTGTSKSNLSKARNKLKLAIHSLDSKRD